MKYKVLGSLLDRVFRNDLNANFNDVDLDIQTLKKRLEDLITSVQQPSEVIDARGGYSVLSGRLSNFDSLISNISVNVKVFGAKGDGVKDDTKAFNDAINSLVYGGNVIVPPGTYMIQGWATGAVSDFPTGGIKLKSNITFSMPGATLKVIPNDKDDYACINITDCYNVKIQGGTIYGERYDHIPNSNANPIAQWGYGIAVVGSQNVTIEGVIVKKCFGDGIYIGANKAGALSENVQIINNMVDENRRNGLSVTGCKGGVISGNSFVNTGGMSPESGVDLEPNPGKIVTGLIIENNLFAGNIQHGLLLASIQAGTRSASGCTIRNNIMRNNVLSGIYLNGADKNVFCSNISQDNGDNGMAMLDSHFNIVSGNQYRKNGYFGLMVGDSKNNAIDGNMGLENGGAADVTYDNFILYGNSHFNSVQGNKGIGLTGTKKTRYGLYIQAKATYNLVQNNDMYLGGANAGFNNAEPTTIKGAGNRGNTQGVFSTSDFI
jgi:parallel beta-helix repeat protein